MRVLKQNSRVPLLPPEIILMVFEAVNDFTTILNIRVTAKFYNNRIMRREHLFGTLSLNKNLRHAIVRYQQMQELGIDIYVRKVEVFSSCYFSISPGADEHTKDILDDTEHPEPGIYQGFGCGRLQYDTVQRLFQPMPDEVPKIRKLVSFLTYVLCTLSYRNVLSAPRRLRVDIISDQSDQDILNYMALRYPDNWLWNNNLQQQAETESSWEAKYARHPSTIRQIFGLAFSEVIKTIWVKNRKKFELILDLYEVRYRLPGLGVEVDGPGILIDMSYWALSDDFCKGLGREYQLELKDIEGKGRAALQAGEVICRRHPGRKFSYRNRVHFDKHHEYFYLLDLVAEYLADATQNGDLSDSEDSDSADEDHENLI